MLRRLPPLLALALLLLPHPGPTACATTEPPPLVLPAQWPAHPRLIATQADWDALAARRRTDPVLEAYVQDLVTQAERLCGKPPLTRVMTGRRLLGVSREFIHRTLLLSLAWRTTGRPEFLARARAELLAVASFPDWNPDHFLDVAEASAGMALGYDWLHQDLSPEDRSVLRRALVEKGLSHPAEIRRTFRMTNNWAQVCAGGLSLAALALGDEEPVLARSLLSQARDTVTSGMAAYAPDGVYPEGPSYWSYGTTYEVLLLASLRSALGQDWGIPAQPGFNRTAFFFAHAISPLGYNFNYADGGERSEFSPALLYLSRSIGEPELASSQVRFLKAGGEAAQEQRFSALACFWWPVDATGPSRETPTHYHGQGSNAVAIWRSSWTDPNALYLAIKAGGAGVSHGHMDGGSFVFEAKGVRWAIDLGMQNYESLESQHLNLWDRRQDSDRWRVFRIGSSSHNTLTIQGGPHRADGLARLLSADEHQACIDLGPVFMPGQVTKAERKALFEEHGVTLKDHLEGLKPGITVRWAMNTRAEVRLLDNREALLRQAGRELRVHFSGNPIKIRVIDISRGPAPYDAANPGVRQLVAEAPAGADGSWELQAWLDSR